MLIRKLSLLGMLASFLLVQILWQREVLVQQANAEVQINSSAALC